MNSLNVFFIPVTVVILAISLFVCELIKSGKRKDGTCMDWVRETAGVHALDLVIIAVAITYLIELEITAWLVIGSLQIIPIRLGMHKVLSIYDRTFADWEYKKSGADLKACLRKMAKWLGILFVSGMFYMNLVFSLVSEGSFVLFFLIPCWVVLEMLWFFKYSEHFTETEE